MHRLIPAVLLLLLLPTPSNAQSVTLPATVRGDTFEFITIRPTSMDADDLIWLSLDSGLSLLDEDEPAGRKKCVVLARKDGAFRVACYAAKCVNGKATFSPKSVCIVIAGSGPVPPDPNPPKPDPPKPDPPSPAPIPLPGFRVLVVYESSTANNTLGVIAAKSVQDYLAAKCIKDGAASEWRVWDKDVKLDNVKQHWKDAMARPRTTIPWLIISNGTSGYEGPLPKTVDETLALLKKIGG